ncbi:MAG TPA: type II toxin-antitoxin system RelE/ParE family toxin [Tepidisphaeraceae bacterium]|nr:type II toxin-antitoxin system RelE/ParE family toxin [Tepidisphaeraceae bacterium]
MFEIQLSSDAQQFYRRTDSSLAKRINRCLLQLEQEPRRHNNIKRLSGPFAGLLRFRIGDWRIVYRIDDIKKQVQVLFIAHRREVYE